MENLLKKSDFRRAGIMADPRGEAGKTMQLVSIKIAFSWIEKLDRLVAENIYPSRAAAIRRAVTEELYLIDCLQGSQD